MTADGAPKMVLTDVPRSDFLELEAATKELLLDADNSLDFTAHASRSSEGSDSTERQADYVLDGATVGEEDSRYVLARISGRGLQAAMMSFRHDDDPDTENAGPGVLVTGQFSAFRAVDFFSFDIEPLHLEGVETLASEDGVQELISTMRHPELTELAQDDPLRAVRCAPVAMALMEMASEARHYAERFLVARKVDDFIDSIPEGFQGAEQMIAGTTALKERLLGDLKQE